MTAPEYYEWDLPYRQWGLDAINAPEAWELLPEKIDNIKIGVLDDGFMIGHEDLKELDVKLRYENVNEETEKAFLNKIHGTHVMGTIATVQKISGYILYYRIKMTIKSNNNHTTTKKVKGEGEKAV